MKYYPIDLFIEIIESVKGVIFIRRGYYEEGQMHEIYYQGINGKLVAIYYHKNDEEFSYSVARGYLHQLGLDYMMDNMFPNHEDIPLIEKTVAKIEEAKNTASQN